MPLAAYETEHFAIAVDGRGRLAALTDRRTGKAYLPPGERAPVLTMRTVAGMQEPGAAEWDSMRGILSLDYAGGVRAAIRVRPKATHVVFELTSVEPDGAADLAVWGPYPTTIRETIGETVGVVQDPNFAIGIQALNVRTLGGFPISEDDVMPYHRVYENAEAPNLTADDATEFYRGNTARRTGFGSLLNAYTRDRRRDRVIPNYGHDPYFVPAFEDGGLVGSTIALFGCPANRVLETLEAIELAEGLPHPLIEGSWGKTSPGATASYLVVPYGEATIEEDVAITRRAGLRYLYHFEPFDMWGHFHLTPQAFPSGWPGLRACAERAGRDGVRLGIHTLSNFITVNDPYVTPVPHPGLARVGTSSLTETVDATQREIPVADAKWFNQTGNNFYSAAVVGQELVRYESVSAEPPWRLRGCTRGAFGTTAASHPAGEAIGKLLDHPYKVFLADGSLQDDMARTIARLCNETGVRQISLDGLEGCWASGMGQYGRMRFAQTWYDALSPELRDGMINDASNPGHFSWHICTRFNWGEPWYGTFRDSQTRYRLRNQDYYRRNLLPCMLGWFKMDAKTTLADIEWMLSLAAGCDAGFGLITDPGTTKAHTQGEAILDAIHVWEAARETGVFTEEQKADLRDPNRAFHITRPGKGPPRLTSAPVEPTAPGS